MPEIIEIKKCEDGIYWCESGEWEDEGFPKDTCEENVVYKIETPELDTYLCQHHAEQYVGKENLPSE